VFRITLTSALALIATPASAQQSSANERAYTLTLTCRVVAAHFNDMAGTAKADDAVRRMGKVLGYSAARQASDVITMASVLGDERRSDPSNMERHRDGCRRFGLVS